MTLRVGICTVSFLDCTFDSLPSSFVIPDMETDLVLSHGDVGREKQSRANMDVYCTVVQLGGGRGGISAGEQSSNEGRRAHSRDSRWGMGDLNHPPTDRPTALV